MKSFRAVSPCRSFLSKAITFAGIVSVLLSAGIAQVQADVLQVRKLSDAALFIQGPTANILAVASSEGLILVDGGEAAWYDELRQVLTEHFPDTPIRALINTHWHPEHTGANVPLGMEGVEIIAHENTRLWLGTEIWQRWSGKTFPPMAEAGRPSRILWDDEVLQIGDTRLHTGFIWNAHTDGDIWVFFEDENILVTGGLVSNGRWPEIDWWTGGYIGGMLDSFVSLLSVPDDSTRIIPAYGEVMTLNELRQQNQMYLTILDRLHGFFINSYSLDDVLAEKPTAEFDSKMGDPAQFISLAYTGFQWRVRDPQNFRILNIP